MKLTMMVEFDLELKELKTDDVSRVHGLIP